LAEILKPARLADLPACYEPAFLLLQLKK